jgi:hypothetical protein
MVTEVIRFTGKIRSKGQSTEKTVRQVEITGRDLPKFAAVLRRQADDARAKGDDANALRLNNLARNVEHARKFTVTVPLDAKLNDQPEATQGKANG